MNRIKQLEMNHDQWKAYYRLERAHLRRIRQKQPKKAWRLRLKMNEISELCPYNYYSNAVWLNGAASARIDDDLEGWRYCMGLAQSIRKNHKTPFIHWSEGVVK